MPKLLKKLWKNDFWRGLIIALFIVFLVRAMVVSAYRIPTGSMRPTLKVGDHLFVSKLAYGLKLPVPFVNKTLIEWSRPKKGHIVVFEYPANKDIDFIKRVVGEPGDVLEMRAGQLYVNGERIQKMALADSIMKAEVDLGRYEIDHFRLFDENFFGLSHRVMAKRQTPRDRFNEWGPVTVKDGHYFVMGDNRDNSKDSRDWGFVPHSHIRGRARIIFFSFRKNPFSIRFSRLGRAIK